MLAQDWFDLGPTSSTRTWSRDAAIESPFKHRVSPLRAMPSCFTASWAKPDPAHTYAINGWGKDMMASTVLLLVRLGMFDNHGYRWLSQGLSEGFDRFKQWCRAHHKTTSLTSFSLKVFKINKLLSKL